MSEKPNPTRGEPLESQANASESTPAEEYEVGPGHPPPDKRWQKGGPSPNPRGRPRKEQSMVPDARKAFAQAINKKVSVPRGDKKVLMTRVEIGLEQLLNQFAKGDRHARRDLMQYADKLGIDFLAQHRQTLEQALTPNYQAILDASPAALPCFSSENRDIFQEKQGGAKGVPYIDVGDAYLQFLHSEQIKGNEAILTQPNIRIFLNFMDVQYRC